MPDAGCSRPSPGRSSSASSPTSSTRTSSSARTASARSRATTSTTRSSSRPAARSIASSTCPPSPTPGCSAATRTGAGRSGCRSTSCSIRGLLNLYGFYGDDFKVECPTGSGNRMTLFEVAQEISRRLSGIFLRDASGRRPVYGGSAKFQDDPHWRDLILFYEYFHGDNGAGLGASHQTGWTGLVARAPRPLRARDGRGRAEDPQGEAPCPHGQGAGAVASSESVQYRATAKDTDMKTPCARPGDRAMHATSSSLPGRLAGRGGRHGLLWHAARRRRRRRRRRPKRAHPGNGLALRRPSGSRAASRWTSRSPVTSTRWSSVARFAWP